MKQQVRLSSEGINLTTWVEADKVLKVGNTMTLKNYVDPDRVWDIEHVGTPHAATDINHGWHVGGM